MTRNPFDGNNEVPWELDPHNPKVEEAIHTTFEFPITGMEVQLIGMALEQFQAMTAEMLAHGHSPSGGAVDRGREVQAMLAAMKLADQVNDRLIGVWRRFVNGQSVGLGDLPPDPFGPGAGPYL
jgi:hypothetical protein